MFATTEARALGLYLFALISEVRQRRADERGAAEIATIVIVTAIVAAGAIAIATLIITKFTDKAGTIPTE